MIDNELNELFRITKRNYNISQLFTVITAVLIIITLYLYLHHNLVRYNNYIYYSYLAMGIVSLILGFTYSKKIRENNGLISEGIKSHPADYSGFEKNRSIQGFLNIILIIVLVGSFFVKGTQLDILNDIFFILIIFSYWMFNRNYYVMFKTLLN
jgi:hypothetical protein